MQTNNVPPLPAGWTLVDRRESPMGTTLRLVRQNGRQHWLMASGQTFAEAFAAAQERMRLYDESGGRPYQG